MNSFVSLASFAVGTRAIFPVTAQIVLGIGIITIQIVMF